MRPFRRQVFAPKLRKCWGKSGKNSPEVLSNILPSSGLVRGALEFADVSAARASLAEGPIAHCSN
jgi:hypothetical protein